MQPLFVEGARYIGSSVSHICSALQGMYEKRVPSTAIPPPTEEQSEAKY